MIQERSHGCDVFGRPVVAVDLSHNAHNDSVSRPVAPPADEAATCNHEGAAGHRRLTNEQMLSSFRTLRAARAQSSEDELVLDDLVADQNERSLQAALLRESD